EEPGRRLLGRQLDQTGEVGSRNIFCNKVGCPSSSPCLGNPFAREDIGAVDQGGYRGDDLFRKVGQVCKPGSRLLDQRSQVNQFPWRDFCEKMA
ncbi:hypothetical protein CH063_14793, partial [Colletotrichum higginsianum]